MNLSSGQGGLSEKDLQAILERYVEVWNTGRVEDLDELTTADFDLRTVPDFKPVIGREALKQSILNVRRAYPDFHLTITEEIFAPDRAVIAAWTVNATCAAPANLPTAGKRIHVDGFSVLFLHQGKIAGEWIAYSDLEWQTQQGDQLVAPTGV